jgi:hypothetical protein
MWLRRRRLRFRRGLWANLRAELFRRGGGERESGAFLLASASDPRRVRELVFLDDLDPHCLTGGISLSGSAYGKLWDFCEQRQLRVVADIHTHPGESVRQSAIDKDNPMVAMPGHLALIMPSFAAGRVRPGQLGVHEYLGNGRWKSSYGRAAKQLVQVGWLA